ncbi:cornifelin homolog A-like isoform 1-T3 [Menidia menidia]|uniref:(Atlantic silverside) hypothetical protein n=1 Tax=Menidia menidia TaxID=238744 RepID=A0A8S4ADD2_9TELE|nr:unnamed protein product [Menidia menidia]
MAEQQPTNWSSELLDCFEDTNTCCYGFWCAPFLACTVSGRLGEWYFLPLCDALTGCTSLFCSVPTCIPPAALSLRVAIRKKYGIKGSHLKDMAATCCCSWCAWCQMHRELKRRTQVPVVINLQSQTTVNMQPPVFVGGMQPFPVMMMPPQTS